MSYSQLQNELIAILRCHPHGLTTDKLAALAGKPIGTVSSSLVSLRNGANPSSLYYTRDGGRYVRWHWGEVEEQAPKVQVSETRYVDVAASAVSAPNDRVISPVAGKRCEFVYRKGNLLWVINPDTGALCCVHIHHADTRGLVLKTSQVQIIDAQSLELSMLREQLATQGIRMAKLANETVKASRFIVWSPQSSKPPTVIHNSESKAYEVAEIMARKHPGQDFMVCALLEGYNYEAPKPVPGKLSRIKAN